MLGEQNTGQGEDSVSPETAGRFTLHRELPAGGMGHVFEAEDPVGPRRVALKLIDLGTDPDSLEIISAERLGAELQTRLCAVDKRVTAIYEAGEMPRYFYIVMEYVDGRDSRSSIREAVSNLCWPLASPRMSSRFSITPTTSQPPWMVAPSAVWYMTMSEPRNIRVTPAGEVKVLDFGIAKALSLTRNYTQIVFGSVQYSSPERLLAGAVDVRRGSLGCRRHAV